MSPGDQNYRPYVSDRPDVTTIRLDGTEDFVLLACDGFFDVVDLEESVRLVKTDMAEHPGTAGPEGVRRGCGVCGEGAGGVWGVCVGGGGAGGMWGEWIGSGRGVESAKRGCGCGAERMWKSYANVRGVDVDRVRFGVQLRRHELEMEGACCRC